MKKKSGVISVFDQMIERNESDLFLDEYSTGIVRLFSDMLTERSQSYQQLVDSFKAQIFWTFDDVTWDAAKDIYNLMKEVYYMGVNKGAYPASQKQLERPKQFFVFFNNDASFQDTDNEELRLELFKLLNKINAKEPVSGGECGVLIKQVKDKLTSDQYEMIKSIDINEYESIKDSVPTIVEE